MYLITALLLAAWLAEFENKNGNPELQQRKQEIFAWKPEEKIEETNGSDNVKFE